MQPSQPSKLNNDRLRVMELLNLVTNHAEISALEAALKRDAALSYKLLRFINSPGCGMLTKIRSIAHALVMLGYDQLYRWLTLLLFTSGKLDVRSEALLKNALVRARMTELLGKKKQLPPQDQERLFIVGIFSLIDVLLNTPMDKALESISLPDLVLNALVKREGIYAPYLKLAAACEQGEQESVEELAGELRLSAEDVNLAHVQAMIWAEDVGRES
jgi:EAL and modified HD-GYP domain-containing signal transduction protein